MLHVFLSSVFCPHYALIMVSNKNSSDTAECGGAKRKVITLTIMKNVEILQKSDKDELLCNQRE